MLIHTFSIAAYDPDEQAFGVGVASKFLAVGAVVPWVRAGVGAIATQAHANVPFGTRGLSLLEAGSSAQETLDTLLRDDLLREHRQVGIVDRKGRSAAHTGSQCFAWAGHRTHEGFTCQGNILAGAQVVEAMADAYRSARGELADRLLATLVAGDDAGGDRRGKQGAAIYVARPNGGYGGDNDRYLDLRVDDDPAPLARLAALLDLHHLYFAPPKVEDRLPISEALARELQAILRAEGYLAAEPSGIWDDDSKRAFFALVSRENLEERWAADDADVIDRIALEYLRRKFGK